MHMLFKPEILFVARVRGASFPRPKPPCLHMFASLEAARQAGLHDEGHDQGRHRRAEDLRESFKWGDWGAAGAGGLGGLVEW